MFCKKQRTLITSVKLLGQHIGGLFCIREPINVSNLIDISKKSLKVLSESVGNSSAYGLCFPFSEHLHSINTCGHTKGTLTTAMTTNIYYISTCVCMYFQLNRWICKRQFTKHMEIKTSHLWFLIVLLEQQLIFVNLIVKLIETKYMCKVQYMYLIRSC